MNENSHFKAFKRAHRRMAIAQVETPIFTSPNGAGKEQESVPLPFWKDYFKWENLTVAGRNIEKGWVVPQPIGVALVIVMLGAVGWAYRSNTADARETRDAIIKMETMLNERTRSFEREQDKLQRTLDSEVKVAQLQREQQNDKIRALQTQRASR